MRVHIQRKKNGGKWVSGKENSVSVRKRKGRGGEVGGKGKGEKKIGKMIQ